MGYFGDTNLFLKALWCIKKICDGKSNTLQPRPSIITHKKTWQFYSVFGTVYDCFRIVFHTHKLSMFGLCLPVFDGIF